MRKLLLTLALCMGCSSAGTVAGDGGLGDGGGGDGGGSVGSAAAALATKLRGDPHFLIGMGNDLATNHAMDGAYTLGPTLDLHYAYLVGLGSGAWPTWNSNGSFVNILTDSAAAKGTTPMFTLYQMAAWGDGNLAGLSNDAFMQQYWDATRLLFQRIAIFGKPAVVHAEPDFWGYAQQQSKGDPSKLAVKISASECAGLPADISGMGQCIIKLGRMYAPQAAIGLHASVWAGAPADIVTFLKAVGADRADFVATDMLDRDAGCYEAHTDPSCMRGGTFYWDESNQTSPNFHDFLTYSKSLHDGVGLPILWWQVPFGVPSTTPGGTAGHYRDNRVHYIFNHLSEFVASGGVGVTFGTGAGNQTYITSDGGQFKNAVTTYFQSPTHL